MNIVLSVGKLIQQTVTEFLNDNATQMAAALSYYALFAIPSLLLITLSLLNLFIADEQAKMSIINLSSELFGARSAGVISQIIQHLDENGTQSIVEQWGGIILLLITATGIVGHLQRSLNKLWDTFPSHHNTFQLHLIQRLSSLVFIILAGILLLIVFVSDTLLSFLNVYISSTVGVSTSVLSIVNHLFSFIMMVLIISLIYRYVPNGKMSWKDILVGALVTTILFSIGKYLIGIYLDFSTVGSVYGAAGSILLLLIWIYYTSLIFFFGAEFTQVYANVHGSGISTSNKRI